MEKPLIFLTSKPNWMPKAVSADNEKRKVLMNAHEDFGEYFQIQLFIAELHDHLHCELLKSHKETWAVVYKTAMELVIIQQDKLIVKKPIIISAIKNELALRAEEELKKEEMEAINAISARQGLVPFLAQKEQQDWQ